MPLPTTCKRVLFLAVCAGAAMSGPVLSVVGTEEIGKTRIARWKDDKRAAVLLMFDDSVPSHVKNVVPALKKRDMTATFYVNAGTGHWQALRDAWEKKIPAEGMEYGNHTMTHKGARDVAHAEEEIRESNEVILGLFAGKQPRLLSYGQPGVPKGAWNITDDQLKPILAKYHLVHRPKFQMAAVHLKTADDMTRLVDAAVAKGSCECVLFHGVGGDWISVPLEVFTALLDKLTAERDRVWVAGHIAAHQYETERDAADVKLLEAGDLAIRLQLTSKADPQFYDFPLTLVTQVPPAWKHCQIAQGAKKSAATPVGGAVRYEAVPNGPPIAIEPREKP